MSRDSRPSRIRVPSITSLSPKPTPDSALAPGLIATEIAQPRNGYGWHFKTDRTARRRALLRDRFASRGGVRCLLGLSPYPGGRSGSNPHAEFQRLDGDPYVVGQPAPGPFRIYRVFSDALDLEPSDETRAHGRPRWRQHPAGLSALLHQPAGGHGRAGPGRGERRQKIFLLY